MKILLTGAHGMVGQNILEASAKYDHMFLSPSRSELDLLDLCAVKTYLNLHRPDMVIHAAGVVGGIQANLARPATFLVDNMMMGLNLIMSAKDCGIKQLLNLGSSCMYPRNAKNPLSEDLLLKGELEPTNEGYALAKVSTTRLCEYIRKEEPALQYKTVIPCNLYGRYDKFAPSHSHMIPAVIRRLDEAKSLKADLVDIWGDGEARREFMYAADLADFVFYALHQFDQMPQNINLGLGKDYSINEYYRAIADVVGYKGSFVHDLSKPVGMVQKLMDDSKLVEFGWSHKTGLKEGLKLTYEFYLREVKNG